jgi:Tol biopolymer transport system component
MDSGANDARPLGPCRMSWLLETAGKTDVYTSNFDGSSPQQLTLSPDDDINPVWSPSGDRILVTTRVDGAQQDVFSITPDGAGVKNLTKPIDDAQGAVSDFGYAWSPDGNSIALNRGFTLWTMAADGSNARLLANLPNMQGVVWSPDSNHLLAVARRNTEQNADLYLVSAADGSSMPVVATPTAHESTAVYSPDGTKIAYIRTEEGNADVWTMSTDGTSQVNMTPNTPTSSESIGAWSPDGEMLIVTSNREGQLKPFKIPAAGGSMDRIVTEEPGSSITGDDRTFAISPGSGRIFFTRTLPNEQGTVVGTATVSGNTVRVWSKDNPKARAGTWSPGCVP